MKRSSRSILWRAICAVRSISCRTAALCVILLLTALWAPAARAYEADDPVGRPEMLLTAVSGYGSLSDETVMGDACADAVRAAAGTDFAVVPGGMLIANLEPKPCTYADVCAVLAAPEEPIAAASLTAAELAAMLEAGVSHIVLNDREASDREAIDREASAFGGFPQISGFVFTYDASARPGERVMRIRTEKGELEGAAVYTVAAPESLFRGHYGYPAYTCRDTGWTMAEALAAYIAAGTGDAYTGEGRITAAGCVDYSIVNRFPVVPCVLAAMVIWLGARLWKFKYFDRTTR